MELTRIGHFDIGLGDVIYARRGDWSLILEARSSTFSTENILRSTMTNVDMHVNHLLDWDFYLLGHKFSDNQGCKGLIVPGSQELAVGDFVVESYGSDRSMFTGVVVGADTSEGGSVEIVSCFFEPYVYPSGKISVSQDLVAKVLVVDFPTAVTSYKKIDYKGSTFEANEEKIIGKIALTCDAVMVSRLVHALSKVEGRNG